MVIILSSALLSSLFTSLCISSVRQHSVTSVNFSNKQSEKHSDERRANSSLSPPLLSPLLSPLLFQLLTYKRER
jgi:hypothetical protein